MQLTDRYARRFHYLRLSITESCNFKCNYCLPDGMDCGSRRDELTLPEIERLVYAFALAGTQKVRITGGEPSLRRDLTEIIRICKDTPGIREVAITTNGYRLERDIESWHAAGLDAVNVSVDSLDTGTFQMITGDSRLPSILRGIEKALSLNLPKVKLNAVLLRGYNFGEFDQFLSYVKDHPVALRFIELMQTGDNRKYYQQQHVSGSVIQRRLEQTGWQRIQKSKTAGPAQEYAHPDFAGKLGLIMPYSKDFCADCNRLRVSSRAELFMCLFAAQHQSLRHLLQDDAPDAVIEFLQQTLHNKEAAHHLHEEFTGATRHLAMIGG
ncbi:GTP 3',8-cyclase MoaA [Aliidiomarina sanyensis]|uniref:GTP 3',8-cyclase MoaA n=1 Tax=Aliidiomarina sanyensis TaxID=1249555 RepID=A0A432WRH9_9GAMM|nr:GTP 3',8-cyclase MoaA [Aliidiomarina sanyensis]RUO36368.1 GTP 3',8-cyclase MoaA [Aliidiomarina sanyensis]